jgi:hypothetical protein
MRYLKAEQGRGREPRQGCGNEIKYVYFARFTVPRKSERTRVCHHRHGDDIRKYLYVTIVHRTSKEGIWVPIIGLPPC